MKLSNLVNITQSPVNVLIPNIDLHLKFQRKINEIYDKIRNCEYQNQELIQLRDWLLPMLMNGQVKVEDTYSSNEPQTNLAAEAATAYQN